MKLLLKLFVALLFVWGGAVQAEEQSAKQADKQINETLQKVSQNEKKSASGSGDKETPEDEEEPECE